MSATDSPGAAPTPEPDHWLVHRTHVRGRAGRCTSCNHPYPCDRLAEAITAIRSGLDRP